MNRTAIAFVAVVAGRDGSGTNGEVWAPRRPLAGTPGLAPAKLRNLRGHSIPVPTGPDGEPPVTVKVRPDRYTLARPSRRCALGTGGGPRTMAELVSQEWIGALAGLAGGATEPVARFRYDLVGGR